MKWEVNFYKSDSGNIPVLDFLSSLPNKHKNKALFVIDLLSEYGYLLKEPYTKHLSGTKLKELRIQSSPNIYRVFYFFYSNRKFILLHAFTKKTQSLPKEEINIAIKRMKDYTRRSNNE
jgi:phage-related protein